MYRKPSIFLSAVILSVLILAACNGHQAPPPGEAEPAASTANTNAPATPQAPPSSSNSAPPPTLEGDYILSEVQHKGQVTMIRGGNSTEISFRPDGTYARVSRLGGKVDHSDSGEFRIENGKHLVLRIRMWKKKFQTPTVEKRHDFTLSSDGTELKMTGKDGKVAVFRRTRVLTSG
jgi:hypothetical protein